MRVIDEYGLSPEVTGEVGIEVEVEGAGVHNMAAKGWNTVGDGSLRGESAEFVLRRPIARKNTREYLYRLHKALNDSKAISQSDRTGVHVHINCQQLNFEETLKFILLFLILEPLLVNYCGEDREGNLFCLRSKDAEAMMNVLHQAAVNGSFRTMQRREWRYAALNITALQKYGSVEFRSLGTPQDVREIEDWVFILLAVFDAAKTFDKPTDMITDVSVMGASQFISRVLGDMAPTLLRGVTINVPRALMEGVRQAQDIAYTYEFSAWRHKKDKKPTKKPNRKTRRSQRSAMDIAHQFDAAEDVPMPDVPIRPVFIPTESATSGPRRESQVVRLSRERRDSLELLRRHGLNWDGTSTNTS
jgi:hypothetical protein